MLDLIGNRSRRNDYYENPSQACICMYISTNKHSIRVRLVADCADWIWWPSTLSGISWNFDLSDKQGNGISWFGMAVNDQVGLLKWMTDFFYIHATFFIWYIWKDVCKPSEYKPMLQKIKPLLLIKYIKIIMEYTIYIYVRVICMAGFIINTNLD